VRFFATAVLIQRETGGNLAERQPGERRSRAIQDSQTRVHTAMAGLRVTCSWGSRLSWIALSFIIKHINLLFQEPMGQMMIVGCIVINAGIHLIKQIVKTRCDVSIRPFLRS
jgi:Flp pilus assembly protein TadB